MKRAALLVAALTIAARAAADPVPTGRLAALLVPGQRVKVEGVSDGAAFRARRIALRDVDGSAKVEGSIESTSADRRTLRINGFPVTIVTATRLYRGSEPTRSRSMLKAGTWVEAKGTWRSGGIEATRIRIKDAPETTAEIDGRIESFDAATSTLVVLSRSIVVDQDVSVVDERTGRVAPGSPADRLRRDDDDGQGKAPLVFGNIVFGGRVEAGFEHQQHYGENATRTSRSGLSRLQLLASSQITDRIEAYVKTTFDGAVGSSPEHDLGLSEAYLQISEVGGWPVSLQVGRQRFRDSREWLFDEYLDAVRLRAEVPHVKFEAAVAHGLFSGPEELRARRDQLQLLASATSRVRGVRVSFHGIARRDRSREQRPVWIAALVERSGDRNTYWTDAAVRRGRADDGTRLRGWALDAGARHTWPAAWMPTVTAAYAFASGDSTRGDGIDTRFRQTGLQDNQSSFGGLRRIAIYGELFDPELSNLQVVTAAIGVQPRRGLAVNGVWHEYLQANAGITLPSSHLEGDLTGVERRLGRELDLLLTLRPRQGIDIEIATGFFARGPAFGDTTNWAFFWRPQLRLYF
jgi:hypothetical protein